MRRTLHGYSLQAYPTTYSWILVSSIEERKNNASSRTTYASICFSCFYGRSYRNRGCRVRSCRPLLRQLKQRPALPGGSTGRRDRNAHRDNRYLLVPGSDRWFQRRIRRLSCLHGILRRRLAPNLFRRELACRLADTCFPKGNGSPRSLSRGMVRLPARFVFYLRRFG